MRVLFTTWAWPSHYLPMVGLGWAFRSAGHEVRVASQPSLADVIMASGLPAVAVGRDLDYEALLRVPMEDTPSPSGSRDWWRSLAAYKPAQAMETFVTLAEAMVDDLVAFARWWRPDLVVCDTTTFAAPVAAAASGAPLVRHTYGPDLMHRVPGIAEALEPILRRYGLGPSALEPLTTVDVCPRSMQGETGDDRTWMRYVPYNGRSVQPRWLLDPPERPRVAVTCGTTSTALDPSGRSLPKQVIEALDGTGVEIVLAISERDRAELGETPPCVRAAGFVPLHLLLPTCDLLIHRGGGTSILTALTYGVPQLLTPQIPDQAFDSYLVGKTGAAKVLYGAETEAGTIRDATRELLSDTRYRDAAARLRAEMAAQTPAEAVVTGLAARIEQGGNR